MHQITVDPWPVIGPEISENSFNVFLPIVGIRSKSEDFYLQMLWNAISELVEQLNFCKISGAVVKRTFSAGTLTMPIVQQTGRGGVVLQQQQQQGKLKQLLDKCFKVNLFDFKMLYLDFSLAFIVVCKLRSPDTGPAVLLFSLGTSR